MEGRVDSGDGVGGVFGTVGVGVGNCVGVKAFGVPGAGGGASHRGAVVGLGVGAGVCCTDGIDVSGTGVVGGGGDCVGPVVVRASVGTGVGGKVTDTGAVVGERRTVVVGDGVSTGTVYTYKTKRRNNVCFRYEGAMERITPAESIRSARSISPQRYVRVNVSQHTKKGSYYCSARLVRWMKFIESEPWYGKGGGRSSVRPNSC